MFFVAVRRTADLSLTTPPESCCNCGLRGALEMVETPLRRTRYFLFFGTELTIRETFPYCRRCRRSAKRVRLSWPAKILCACIVAAALSLTVLVAPVTFPDAVSANPFQSALIIGAGLTGIYFYLRERDRNGRSYYQPVHLLGADFVGDELHRVRLKFHNRAYTRVFSKANADLIRMGALKVEE